MGSGSGRKRGTYGFSHRAVSNLSNSEGRTAYPQCTFNIVFQRTGDVRNRHLLIYMFIQSTQEDGLQGAFLPWSSVGNTEKFLNLILNRAAILKNFEQSSQRVQREVVHSCCEVFFRVWSSVTHWMERHTRMSKVKSFFI